MLPSSVPATPFENAGAELNAEDLEPFYSHPRVLGLAEVMDYPAVLHGDDHMVDKLVTTMKHKGKIDGHAAGLDANAINVYRAAEISTDHECVTTAEAKERIRRGMYVLIREGSVAKDLVALIPVVNEKNARRCVFCTDDKHLDDLIAEGSIDHNVRLAIQHGLDPLLAIQMASLNTAECYGLSNKGAIAPGYEADFLLLDDLQNVTISQVYKSGELVAENGVCVAQPATSVIPSLSITNTVRIKAITEKDIQLPIAHGTGAHVIGITPNSLVTKHLIEEVQVADGYFCPSVEKDQLKMVVVERHKLTGNIGLGIVKGLELKSGAIASTVAHDSHNIVVAGTNDTDILAAIHAIHDMQGGLVVVDKGAVIASLSLEISGLITDRSFEEVNQDLEKLHNALHQIGAATTFNPFLTLSFLCLPVIPDLKLTDMGLFDVREFKHINISAK
jgi:adenine deaminase